MTIKAPISVLRDAAGKIRIYTDKNADLFSQILNIVNKVEACGDWKGKSMKALQNVTRKNQQKFKSGMEELCGLAEFLQKYADEMDRKDQDLQKRIQRI